MASINPQIDDAVPQMKARAAEFDTSMLPMNKWVEVDGPCAVINSLLTRAIMNADRARDNLGENGLPSWGCPEYLQKFRADVADIMNLGALVLSVLPEAPDDGRHAGA